MGYLTQHNELRTRFNTMWGSTTPIAWANAEFTPPSPPSPWVRFVVSDGQSTQTTVGASTNNHRHYGVVYVQIFVPLDAGDSVALGYADTIAGIFRNWYGTNITCRQPRIKDVGPEGNGWYQVNVTVSFFRDELF